MPLSLRRMVMAISPSRPAPAGPVHCPAMSSRHSRGRRHSSPCIGLSTTSRRSRIASISKAAILPAASMTTKSLAAAASLFRPFRQFHELGQRNDRHDAIAQNETIIVLDPADPVGRDAHRLGHRIHGNAEQLASCLYHHDAGHRDGHRQIEPHRGAGSDFALQRNPAADLFDRSADHIHSDAAAGNIRYDRLRSKIRPQKTRSTAASSVRAASSSGGNICLSEALRRTTAGSIPRPSSRNFHQQAVSDPGCRDRDCRGLWFSCRPPLLGVFDTVIQGIAHQMHHGFEKAIHDGLVGFRGLTAA